eukprot:CAMPEP_0204075870 /NCGR_PEP_ID=MMETSP0360-20130528/166993_1 /ASSEMBLY_ACC=CAM_ASM_000342 /TAXON_ID=268821 /ORGANISM="Scrippsiella Hangoei, Strain SHTV-5" /LENGTH=61 /DNA_ID=CAMNT_0051024391 /DNA_START=18 /DNA_END=200 /DNA_ORIENTATION=-
MPEQFRYIGLAPSALEGRGVLGLEGPLLLQKTGDVRPIIEEICQVLAALDAFRFEVFDDVC